MWLMDLKEPSSLDLAIMLLSSSFEVGRKCISLPPFHLPPKKISCAVVDKMPFVKGIRASVTEFLMVLV